VDYATWQRFGVHGEGPVTDPRGAGRCAVAALAVVRRGEPALVDVVRIRAEARHDIVTKVIAVALSRAFAGTAWSAGSAEGSMSRTPARLPCRAGCFTCHGRGGAAANFNTATTSAREHGVAGGEALTAFLRVGLNDMPAFSKEVLTESGRWRTFRVPEVHCRESVAGGLKLLNQ